MKNTCINLSVQLLGWGRPSKGKTSPRNYNTPAQSAIASAAPFGRGRAWPRFCPAPGHKTANPLILRGL